MSSTTDGSAHRGSTARVGQHITLLRTVSPSWGPEQNQIGEGAAARESELSLSALRSQNADAATGIMGLPRLIEAASHGAPSAAGCALATALFGSDPPADDAQARGAANAAKYRAALEAATLSSMLPTGLPLANADVSTEWHVHLVRQARAWARMVAGETGQGRRGRGGPRCTLSWREGWICLWQSSWRLIQSFMCFCSAAASNPCLLEASACPVRCFIGRRIPSH